MLRFYFLALLLSCGSVVFASDDEQQARGKAVYNKWCGICHGDENGSSGGGTQALRVLYKGAVPAKLEERTDLTPALIKSLVRQGRAGMPNFRYTEVSPKDLEAITAYLTRNNEK